MESKVGEAKQFRAYLSQATEGRGHRHTGFVGVGELQTASCADVYTCWSKGEPCCE